MATGVTGTPCLLLLLPLLGLFCHGSMASDPEKRQLPGAMVVGTVYCDTCFHQQFSKMSHFISGAVVALECGGEDAVAKPGFRQEARTNSHGVFRVHLPPSIGKHLKSIQACSVKLVSSGQPFCSVAASATSSSVRLRSRKSGVHVFSAGFFTFKPLQQPELCYQKPSPAGSPQLGSSKTFGPFPKLPLPAFPLFSPLPQLPPLPNLPSSPNLPSFLPPAQSKPYLPPSSTAPAMDQKQDQPAFLQPPLIPSFGGLPSPSRPFQPPSLQPLNPFQPPPSFLPSLPFQPPPSSFGPPLPKPTAPSSPLPGFPFPSFPFPSTPFFPGVPSAFPSTGGEGAAPPP
ncbi:hypothetical protein Taro_050381 [Colocasia esculenta]|uniref:Pollen Ole e 1 allergen and extensin family protein n=1 Tax=Colocasia esculenta TaxID=4460 RepID=A0A843XDA7_COLES|nr:hypothetical protein [Colocasia esculenta]